MKTTSLNPLLLILATSLLASCVSAPTPIPVSSASMAKARSLINTADLRSADSNNIYQVDQRTISVKDKLLWPIKKVCLESGDASRSKCEKGFNYRIVEDDDFNAFAHGSKNITLHSGLIKRTISDDELAFVIAHEAGHHIANHLFETKYNSYLGKMAGGILMGALTAGILAGLGAECEYGEDCSWMEDTIGGSVEEGMEMGEEFAVASYSREQELEADKIATEILRASQFKVEKVVPLLAYMGKLTQTRIYSEFGDSHPSGPERLGAFLERLGSASIHSSQSSGGGNSGSTQKSGQSLANLGIILSSEIKTYGYLKTYAVLSIESPTNVFKLERGDGVWMYEGCDGSRNYLSTNGNLAKLTETKFSQIKAITVFRKGGFRTLSTLNPTHCKTDAQAEKQGSIASSSNMTETKKKPNFSTLPSDQVETIENIGVKVNLNPVEVLTPYTNKGFKVTDVKDSNCNPFQFEVDDILLVVRRKTGREVILRDKLGLSIMSIFAPDQIDFFLILRSGEIYTATQQLSCESAQEPNVGIKTSTESDEQILTESGIENLKSIGIKVKQDEITFLKNTVAFKGFTVVEVNSVRCNPFNVEVGDVLWAAYRKVGLTIIIDNKETLAFIKTLIPDQIEYLSLERGGKTFTARKVSECRASS